MREAASGSRCRSCCSGGARRLRPVAFPSCALAPAHDQCVLGGLKRELGGSALTLVPSRLHAGIERGDAIEITFIIHTKLLQNLCAGCSKALSSNSIQTINSHTHRLTCTSACKWQRAELAAAAAQLCTRAQLN